MVTFVVSGLWHGANVTFLIWGFAHGLFYTVERVVSPLFRLPTKIKNSLGWLVTFSLVNFSWLFFRAQSGKQVWELLQKIGKENLLDFSGFRELLVTSGHFTAPARMLIFAFPLFFLVELLIGKRTFSDLFRLPPAPVRWGFYYVLVLMILFLGVLHSAPQFIYFQF